MIIIYWDLYLFCQIFLTPQVIGSMIITNKHGIYEFPQKFLNELTPQMLGNYKISRNSPDSIELKPSVRFSSKNISARIYFIFLNKCVMPNLKIFQYQT